MLENLKIEVFYNDEGVLLAEYHFDEITYAVIRSDDLEYFTIYESYEDGEKYLPEDLLAHKHRDELYGFRRGLYRKMLKKLNEELGR